jgi:succinate dehydrogenase / fumarate reductase iron-sulfur subunit
LKVRLRVLRSNSTGKREWQAYQVEVGERESVLGALERVRDEQDETLAFREGCSAGLCGACGMLINGSPALACATLVSNVASAQLRLEPLPGFEVVRDLVVDSKPMHAVTERMKPYLVQLSPLPEEESEQTPEQHALPAEAAKCLACGCCLAACPIWQMNREFIGPAAGVRAYRFLSDNRDEGAAERLAAVGDESTGVWRCQAVLECSRVCPAGIDVARIMARWRNALVQASLGRKGPNGNLRQSGKG